MPTRRSRRDAQSRADARRRARDEARGITPTEEPLEEAVPTTSRPGGFLSTFFPPAPPLPGQPDPLAGFRYDGPFRGVVEALYLLARHPLPWLLGGLLWAPGHVFVGESLASLAVSLISFGGLIGAGWFAPWRPWLSGLAAGLLGWILFIAFFLIVGASAPSGSTGLSASPSAAPTASGSVSASASPETTPSPAATVGASPAAEPTAAASPPPTAPTTGPTQIATALTVQTAIQILLGTVAGFYGGYLRRRMAATRRPTRGGNRRR
jgi:hypothetical protein